MLGKWPKSVSCFSKRTLKMGKKFYGILREIDDVTNTTISTAVPNAIEKLISIFSLVSSCIPNPLSAPGFFQYFSDVTCCRPLLLCILETQVHNPTQLQNMNKTKTKKVMFFIRQLHVHCIKEMYAYEQLYIKQRSMRRVTLLPWDFWRNLR